MKPRKKEKKEKERTGKKYREPKKLTGWDGGQRNSEQDKHLEKKRKKIFLVQEQWNFSHSSSGVAPSASNPGVCI
jgi:hypothetical protein